MEALVSSSHPCCHFICHWLPQVQVISQFIRHWDVFRQTRGKLPNVAEVITEQGILVWSSVTSEQWIHMYVALFTLYQQNIGQLCNANKLPHLPGKECSRLYLPQYTILLICFIITGEPSSLRYGTLLWDFEWKTIPAFHLFFFWSLTFLPDTFCWSPFIMKSIYVFKGQSQSCAVPDPWRLKQQQFSGGVAMCSAHGLNWGFSHSHHICLGRKFLSREETHHPF